MELVTGGIRAAVAVFVLATIASGLSRWLAIGLAVVTGAWCASVVAGGADHIDVSWLAIAREGVLGAALGVAAAVPLVAAATAGRWIDTIARPLERWHESVFGILAAAVFVGIDGHVAFVTALADSHRHLPVALGDAQPNVVATIAALLAIAVRLALPWLVTGVVVHIALGIGGRLAARAVPLVATTAALPAALAMMTAALCSTLAVAIAALIRAAT